MARFRRLLVGCLHFAVKNRKDKILCRNALRCFCSNVESPELPDWFMSVRGAKSCDLGLDDDDFVLTSQVKGFLDKWSGTQMQDQRAKTKIITREIDDPDVDGVCQILKGSFTSPGAVVRAFGDCSVKVSEELVAKILKRFSNDWVPAFGFFLWAEAQIGYKHSHESYDVMVDILGKCKQFGLMWGLVEEMMHAGGLVSLVTITKVMRRLAGAGRWGEAINTFRGLEHFGVKKDTASMNVLLDTLCKERSVNHAREAFLEFRSKIPPDSTSFNALIHGWCKARKMEEARKTMMEMREFGFTPCVITYTCLIEAYCLERDFPMVSALLDEMHVQGCSPNIVTYTIVMHSLGKANKIEEAHKIFEEVKKDGCVPDTSFYNSLIYILCKEKKLQDAEDVYEKMRVGGITPNVTTYNTLILAFCRRSLEKKALELLMKMEENSCNPDLKTYTPLLKLCCRKQWVKILLYLLGHMFKRDISPDFGTYILLINGLCQNGKLEQSCLVFQEMIQKGLVPNHYAYSKLLEALEREKMYSEKEKIQHLMMHTQNIGDTANHVFHKQQPDRG